MKKNESELKRKNSSNWKFIFYSNKKDYRIIVPKANPAMGWTFNFASPYTYVIIILIILILVFFSRIRL